VLQVDEHRLAIRGYGNTSDFATSHTGEDALDLFGLRIGNQHLVVVRSWLRSVGLDEDATVGVAPDAVG